MNITSRPGMPVTEFPHPEALQWMRHAACLGAPTEWWMPEPERYDLRSSTVTAAILTCHACPVQDECRIYEDQVEDGYLSLNSVHGIWGGETPRQRLARRGNQHRKEDAA